MKQIAPKLIVCLCLSLLVVIVAGCGGGGGGNAGNSISFAGLSTSPSTLSSDGGTVTLTGTVVGASSIKSITAKILKPDGSYENTLLVMQPVAQTASTYSVNYTYARNRDINWNEQTYTVTITVTDLNNVSTTSSPFSFKVPAMEKPPAPPA